jgi:hypothetical protein
MTDTWKWYNGHDVIPGLEKLQSRIPGLKK